MIVRTYGRRNRSLNRSYSGGSGYDDTESDGFGEPFSQESPQDIYSFAFSSQDSPWSFDSEPFGGKSSQEVRELEVLPPRKHRVGADSADGKESFRKMKKAKNGKRDLELSRRGKSKGTKPVPVVVTPALAGTATLMETQEFGEMMEHLDEVNFALDGLRRAQPHRIRRASLLTLLSICGTAQQRRLLRTHGYVTKSIPGSSKPIHYGKRTVTFVKVVLWLFIVMGSKLESCRYEKYLRILKGSLLVLS